jgi:hypothetical protein
MLQPIIVFCGLKGFVFSVASMLFRGILLDGSHKMVLIFRKYNRIDRQHFGIIEDERSA